LESGDPADETKVPPLKLGLMISLRSLTASSMPPSPANIGAFCCRVLTPPHGMKVPPLLRPVRVISLMSFTFDSSGRPFLCK